MLMLVPVLPADDVDRWLGWVMLLMVFADAAAAVGWICLDAAVAVCC